MTRKHFIIKYLRLRNKRMSYDTEWITQDELRILSRAFTYELWKKKKYEEVSNESLSIKFWRRIAPILGNIRTLLKTKSFEELIKEEQILVDKKEEKERNGYDKDHFDYSEYLQSRHWINMRAKAIERDEGRCKLCNSSDNLNVHHRSYKHMWTSEELDDIITLCNRCHSNFDHNLLVK